MGLIYKGYSQPNQDDCHFLSFLPPPFTERPYWIIGNAAKSIHFHKMQKAPGTATIWPYEEIVVVSRPKVNSSKDADDYKIEEKISGPSNGVEIAEEEEPLPKVEIECPKCENIKAFHWERYNDDGEIVLLYRCTRCKHVWVEAS